jgi:hypothetical protein
VRKIFVQTGRKQSVDSIDVVPYTEQSNANWSYLVQLESLTQASLLLNHNVLHFVDRPFYLDQLRAFYEQSPQQEMRFVLHSMGGVG